MKIIKTIMLISLTVPFLVPETSGQAVNIQKLKPILLKMYVAEGLKWKNESARIQTGTRSLLLLMARYGFAVVIIGEPMRQLEISINPTGMKGHGDLGIQLSVRMIL